jgi:hypothetical protein
MKAADYEDGGQSETASGALPDYMQQQCAHWTQHNYSECAVPQIAG